MLKSLFIAAALMLASGCTVAGGYYVETYSYGGYSVIRAPVVSVRPIYDRVEYSSPRYSTRSSIHYNRSYGRNDYNRPRANLNIRIDSQPRYYTHTSRRVVSYDVVYIVHGREYRDRLHYHPGSWIDVRVSYNGRHVFPLR